jgi:hypothetical protein
VKRIAPAMALVLLLLPVAAHAKGVNVRISSAPNGTDAGEPWTTLVTVRIPGHGPQSLEPQVIIRKDSVRKTFPTFPTSKNNVYRARVIFPSRGTWRYGVYDGMDRVDPGLGQVHWFPPVTIAAGQTELDEPPLPVSGEVEPGPERRGQLPPETYVVPGSDEDESEGNGAMFPVLAFLLAAAVAGPVWLRRRRNKKRAA